MTQKRGKVPAFLRRRPRAALVGSKCSCYVLIHCEAAEGRKTVMGKLDFWAVVAVGTQLTLAAIVQLTVLS